MARLVKDAPTEVRCEGARKLHPLAWQALQGSRWLLLKRPTKLRPEESAKLSEIQQVIEPVYRGHLLKESFLDVFAKESRAFAEGRMEQWLAWAARSRLKPFVRLGRTVRKLWDGILAFIDSGLTNARLEGMNNKTRPSISAAPA